MDLVAVFFFPTASICFLMLLLIVFVANEENSFPFLQFSSPPTAVFATSTTVTTATTTTIKTVVRGPIQRGDISWE